MQKLFVKILTVVIFLSVYTSGANAFLGFGQNGNNNNTTAAPTLSSGNVPLTPDQFKNAVNTLHQQSQDQFNKQMQQDIAKTPPPTSNTNNATNQPTETNPTTTITPTAPAPGLTPTPSMSAKPIQNTPPANYSTQAPQGQVYTGYGNTSPAPSSPGKTITSPSSSGGNSGGWNIQY